MKTPVGKAIVVCIPLMLFAFFLPAREAEVVSISVCGNKLTKPFVVLREMTIRQGSVVNVESLPELLRLNQNNIYNTGLFNEVIITDTLVGNTLHLTVKVRERWYVFPIPFVKFEERTFNEWWADKDLDRLAYGGTLVWQNVTGRDETMVLSAQAGYSRRVYAGFSRPFIFPRQRIGMYADYNYINNKEVGSGTVNGQLKLVRQSGKAMQFSHHGNLEFTKRFTPRQSLSWGASFRFYQPSDSILRANPYYLSHTGKTEYYPTFYISYNRDERDIHAYPLSGFRYSFSLALSGLPHVGTTQFLRFSAGFSHYIPLSKRFYFAYQNRMFMITGKRVPFYDKYFLGFDYFVRGYESYVVDGSFINISKAEFKYAVFPRRILHVKQIPFKKFRDFPFGLYLTAFADAGYVADETWNNTDNTLKNKFLTGYGVGLNVLGFYDTQFRFEASMNNMGKIGLYFDTRLSLR